MSGAVWRLLDLAAEWDRTSGTRLARANQLGNCKAGEVLATEAGILQSCAAELRAQVAADDPPDYDPDDEAERIAEEYADAAAELARIEAEEAHDRAGEQWQEAAYQPAPPDPYSGGVS